MLSQEERIRAAQLALQRGNLAAMGQQQQIDLSLIGDHQRHQLQLEAQAQLPRLGPFGLGQLGLGGSLFGETPDDSVNPSPFGRGALLGGSPFVPGVADHFALYQPVICEPQAQKKKAHPSFVLKRGQMRFDARRLIRSTIWWGVLAIGLVLALAIGLSIW